MKSDSDKAIKKLLAALQRIISIEYAEDGGDWDEIDKAKEIAKKAISEYDISKQVCL